ncbi:glycine betaine ABC transporter substrate-binding protein [Clostridium akagii]|uniref:ABC transporter permease/substrate-binding protein n=1 Tax=Clostridium akagii TaxID=91623 RepID=UPI00047A87C6|nr:glycine betaine ABC transporter substrate-binding protein [Clostridium akagii]
MGSINSFISFVIDRKGQIGDLLLQHIELTLLAVAISIIIGVPLGIFIVGRKKISTFVLGLASVMQSIPSIALLGFLIPVFGIGSKPAIVMVVVYSLLPIIKNTFTGLNNIDEAIIEAGEGLGLTKSQILLKVRFPLAMPVIMSGIRISAVTAVGLMTIAAFVGAGGLGYLVFSGIQTLSNNMILAGAIPACILALVLDFVLGKVEEVVLPRGMSEASSTRKRKPNKVLILAKKYRIALIALIVIVIASSIGYNYYNNRNTIVIGSKNFNEQLILGNILGTLIEDNTDYKVKETLNLGGTSVVFNALKAGDVDLYVEYTGTGLVDIMKEKSIGDADKVYDKVQTYFNKEYGIEWLKPLGFNNTYVLAMKKGEASKYNINSISDLAKVSNQLTIGSTMEFLNRVDGYPGLQKIYGLNFKASKGLDSGLRYSALASNETQVADAFSTDGILQKMDLKTLTDDKHFFPPYYAVPIVKQSTLEKFPKIKPLIEKLQGKITDEDMRKMNLKVDNGADPKVVGDAYLRSIKMIK